MGFDPSIDIHTFKATKLHINIVFISTLMLPKSLSLEKKVLVKSIDGVYRWWRYEKPRY